MIAISWNCRALRNFRAEKALSHLVREKDPDVLFLMETKLSIEEMSKI